MRKLYRKFQINRTNSIANRTVQTCEFCVHHILKNGLSQLKNCLYFSLMLLK
ncbi:hypothetical protein O3M35_002855 [Rhynocoris fuscipes]|uniref:Uncharacterized protein n=1 Tax=Rhynocoris fuscipes TaxID=488301 RepID=A0AAW1CLV7_9HEMI